jgi:hypothetical protein
MKNILLFGLLLFSFICFSQADTKADFYYKKLPKNPTEYTPGTIVARMIDGLGFRYYWATEGLKEVDLAYKPSQDARTLRETMNHIYGLSKTILNSAKKIPTDFTLEEPNMSYDEKRSATLNNFRMASTLFLKTKDISKHTIVFKRENGSSEFPFWNHINGPIEDAVWHAGQVVVLRRSAGNPINPKVNVFLGKLND